MGSMKRKKTPTKKTIVIAPFRYKRYEGEILLENHATCRELGM